MSTLDLVARARKRDVSTWAQWYEEHYRHLYRYAFRKTGSREDAEDIASQTFLEALKGIDSYQDQGGPILAWLYGIARNLISQKFRKERRASLLHASLLVSQDEESEGNVIPEHLDLIDAIRQLTQEQQDVIVLRFFLGKSSREVGLIMGKSENAIFALQFRAVNSLRRRLSDVEERSA